MKPLLKWTALALAVCLPLSAQAHRAWMLPSATVLSGEDPWVTVDAAVSNDLFYFEHFPMRLQGIGEINEAAKGPARPAAQLQVFAPNGELVQPQNGSMGRYRSTFDVNLKEKGTYKLAIANNGIFARWKENGENKRWMGSPAEFSKAVPKNAQDLSVTDSSSRMEVFVTSGEPTDTVLQTTGKGLELKAVTHPNDLFAEETATFVLLLDGKPASHVDVSVIPGGNRYRDNTGEIKTKSNDKGEINITWPTAGMYWLEAETTSQENVTAPATQRRATYSATLEVLPQ